MRQYLFPVLVALTLVMTGAADALAKAGSTSKSSSGSSLGSRGSRTADAPMERTLSLPSSPSPRVATPPPPPSAAPRPGNVEAQPLSPGLQPGLQQPAMRAPAMAGAAGMAAPAAAAQPGFFQRNPFMAGMAGGLVGAGIGSMLFGHSPALAAASDAAPGASILGLLIQIAVIGGLVWLAFKLFRGRAPAGPNPYAAAPRASLNPYAAAPRASDNPYAAQRSPVEPRFEAPLSPVPPVAAAPQRVQREFEPTEADQNDFTNILLGVQQSWSAADPAALRAWATPEMVTFLAQDLGQNTAEGLVNRVEQITLREGDVVESWREDKSQYVTARLVFDCLDYMVRTDTGALVSGSRTNPVTHAELWTFVRPTTGGSWLLSAIQQV
jgi:predicted lipid-binding transport protein (Tim44 family)